MRLRSGVQFFILFVAFAVLIFGQKTCLANDEAIKQEMAELKRRIFELEERLGEQEEASKALGSIKEAFEGLKIGAGATFIVQGTHNANAISPKEDVADASYSIDLEIEKEFKGIDGKAFMHLEAGGGAGVEDELTVFSNVNRDADNEQNVRLTEVYYEQNLFDKKLSLTFGKLDSTVYLDANAFANDETAQFLGRIYRNSSVIEFPDNSFGLRLGLAPIELFDIELAMFDADTDWEDAFDSIFLGGQINFKPNLFEREGNYRILAWLNDRDHIKWLDTTKDTEENYGFGLGFDQGITDNLGVFARYGWQNPKVYLSGSSFSLEQSYSLGLQLKGSLWVREDDILGFAFGGVIPSDDYKKADPTRNAKKEGHFECYYSYKVNDHLTLSPDLQVIWDPYGYDATYGDDTILVGGLRAQIDF